MKRLEVRCMPAMAQYVLSTLPKGSVLGRYNDVDSTGFVIVAAVGDDQTDRLVRELAKYGTSDFVLVSPIDNMYKRVRTW